MSLLDRAMAKIDKDGPNGCWVWTASIRPDGYGQIRAAGRPCRAHRVVYELLKGPIPLGLQLDHLCRNRKCVNPDHLEPVTNRENTIRGDAPRVNGERRRAITHCKHGHPLSGENVLVTPGGKRVCRACGRANMRRHAGMRPSRRARGPLRLVAHRNGRCVQLECGHEVVAQSSHKPTRMICTACESLLNHCNEPPEGVAS